MEQYQRQCVIHLDPGHDDRNALRTTLSELLGVPYSHGGLKTSWANIDVDKKSELDLELCPDDLEFSLEIIGHDEVTIEFYKTKLKEFYEQLKSLGYRPIPACDFEDELHM